METLFRLLANRTVKEKSELSLCQVPLSMEEEEYLNGLPCPPPGDLSNPGVEPVSLTLTHWQAGALPLAPLGSPMTVEQMLQGKCVQALL